MEPQDGQHPQDQQVAQDGRVAVSVWASAPENPWLGLVFAAVTEATGFPVPPPGVPGPFSLGDPVLVDGLLRSAGFTEVVVEPLAVPTRPTGSRA